MSQHNGVTDRRITLPHTALALSVVLAAPLWAENWIQNGDFESPAPTLWQGAHLDRQVVRSGQGALRLDEPADRLTVSASYGQAIAVSQTEPQTVMAALWMRFDAKRQTGPIRGGVTFRVKMADGTALAWYGSFALEASEMGSWVYREGRWKPRAPIATIQPAVYLHGCEGSLYVDDLYLGPPVKLATPPRTTIPLAVTGSSGRFTDWPRFELTGFHPAAHVFHLAGKNEANLELTCEIDVKRPAPAYLTSAWGSQYWTLYCPPRRELAQIYTDERLDLSVPGRRTSSARMCGFSSRASDLAASGYVFVTEGSKSFLVYSTGERKGEPYKDPRTGKTFSYWDTVKVGRLSRALGPAGVAAPFSLADLNSYRLSVSARADGRDVRVRPTLTDARGSAVPLYGLELRGKVRDKEVKLAPEHASDGVPTGDYLGRFPGERPRSIQVRGTVRLACPGGTKEERIDATVTVAPPAAAAAPALPRLDLLGWGYPAYSLSPKASHGPDSMRRLIADAKASGVTRLLVHARTSKETLYASRIAPAATVGEWDTLAQAATEGHKQGVEIHAAYILGIAQEADLKAHPQWAALGRGGKPNGWYCYNHPEVRRYHASLLAEIVERYKVAGVALDFCRPGGGCFCPLCAKAFEARHGKPLKGVEDYDPDWVAWRRNSITEYMRELRQALRQARPDAKLGGYVWGRLAPDEDRAGQDWPRWLKEGIMDFVAVGVYTPSTARFRAQCHALRTIADRDLGGRVEGIFPLLGVGYIQQANPSHAAADAVIGRHLDAAASEGLTAAGFFAFYGIRPHIETVAAHSRARRGR